MSVTTERVLSSRAVIGEIMKRLTAVPPGWVGRCAMMIDSDQDQEEYGWLGMAPQLREWIGGRNPVGLRENSQKVTNRHFEATIEVPVRHLRRDKFGQTRIRIADLARRSNTHKAKLLSTQIINGESTVCYDGQFFFDTDHSEGDSGSQSNDITVDISAAPTSVHGTTTDPSVEEFQYVVTKLIQQIISLNDDQGEPMNEDANAFTIMVPTSLMLQARRALVMGAMSGSGFASQLDIDLDDFQLSLAVNPRLDSDWTDKIAAFRTDAEVKPLIFQTETPVRVSAKAEGSDFEHDNDAHEYGVDYWGEAAYGFWQMACLAQMT